MSMLPLNTGHVNIQHKCVQIYHICEFTGNTIKYSCGSVINTTAIIKIQLKQFSICNI